jgi:hypothetical protein
MLKVVNIANFIEEEILNWELYILYIKNVMHKVKEALIIISNSMTKRTNNIIKPKEMKRKLDLFQLHLLFPHILLFLPNNQSIVLKIFLKKPT